MAFGLLSFAFFSLFGSTIVYVARCTAACTQNGRSVACCFDGVERLVLDSASIMHECNPL